MSVLRKRHDANDPCELDPDDDKRFFSTIFSLIPCIPSFWKIFAPHDSQIPECTTSTQFRKVMEEVAKHEWGDVKSFLIPPCDKMSISTSIQKSNTVQKYLGHLMLLRFHYLDEDYQEIENVRDFGMETFWSSIGGFIGIFLGYSLLQIPDLLWTGICWAKRMIFPQIV
jgi:hypothetical protein